MKVTCKITGEDKTSWLLNKWEKEREAKELQKKISQEFKLNEKKEAIKELDKFMWKLYHKNGTTEY